MNKIIFIHYNYEPEHFLRTPDPDDRFYTYGFGSFFARNLKHFYPAYEVEMWRLDSFIDQYYQKNVQGVLFRIFPSKTIFKLGNFSRMMIRELKAEIEKNDPIIFVSHIHTWLLYQIAYYFPSSRIIASHHGDWSPFFRLKQRSGLRTIKDIIDVLAEKLVLKNIDYFLICDKYQLQYIKKAAPNSNYIFYNPAVDLEKIVPIPKPEARDLLGWDMKKKYILYVGKLYEYKQTYELINIWKDIRASRPDTELVIIGNSKNDRFYDFAIRSGAKVIGRVLNSELNKYYSAADVYVLIALRKDYFGCIGRAPLESLACNTPVVSYSLHNYTGKNIDEIGEIPTTLEEYREDILKVLDNPGKYKNMRENILNHYSYEASAKKIAEVIKELESKY
ncbi:MAG: glycosyltransferase family 4 protein [Ignavibacteria bacterium]